MKRQQSIKGLRLTANTPLNIESLNSPVVAIQNQGASTVNVTFNDGEPMVFGESPFTWEPYIPLSGTIETDGSDVVVFY